MATSVVTQTLTVDISEKITLNGTTYDTVSSLVIPEVANYVSNVFRVTSGPNIILTFSATGTSARNTEYQVDRVKYVRLTNLDAGNIALLSTTVGGKAGSTQSIAPGGSVVLTSMLEGGGTIQEITVNAPAGTDIGYVIALNDSGDVPPEE
jgi:hypothetical protein